MKTREKLFRWIIEHKEKLFYPPKNIPISLIEIEDMIKEEPLMFVPMLDQSPKIFGFDTEITSFAEMTRAKRLGVSIRQYMVEYPIDDALSHNSEILLTESYRQLKSNIVTDRTLIRIALEWDVLAGIKRFLHITKWFPIKQVLRTIDCSIFYPYCHVTFPHNKHTKHFKIKNA